MPNDFWNGEMIKEITTYLYQAWINVTDLLWWKSLIGGILAVTIGAENISLFAALLIVSFVDFGVALVGILWKRPKCFRLNKVLTWGVKIVVYWLIVTAFYQISKNIDFANYLTKTVLYVYIFTEALSIIRNDIKFGLTKAKYPSWLMERLHAELEDVNVEHLLSKTHVKGAKNKRQKGTK